MLRCGGVRPQAPCFSSGVLTSVLQVKTLEKLCLRLRAELRLGVAALCAPESALSRPMRNALLVMQGRRLAQISEMLTRWLEPEEVLLLFEQELVFPSLSGLP